MISYKIENLPDKQRKLVDDWANSQENIQQSLTNLIMHTVAFVGNEDVMDFEVQRKLHMLLSDSNVVSLQQEEQHPVVEEKKIVTPASTDQAKVGNDPISKATGLFEDE